jgi:chromosome segregation ATPase
VTEDLQQKFNQLTKYCEDIENSHTKTVLNLQAQCDSLQRERDYWRAQCIDKSESSNTHTSELTSSASVIRNRLISLLTEIKLLTNNTTLHSDILNITNLSISPSSNNIDDLLSQIHINLSDIEHDLIPLLHKYNNINNNTDDINNNTSRPRICLSDFQENDIALFFPTNVGDYVAFNIGSPHHYLSPESKELIGRSTTQHIYVYTDSY